MTRVHPRLNALPISQGSHNSVNPAFDTKLDSNHRVAVSFRGTVM